MTDLRQFARDFFKAAQSPQMWLLSADHLRDGAEAILEKELVCELPYIRAHMAAIEKASEIAYSEGNKIGIQEIEARVPNYPVAQLLYAYALENLFKGIIVAKDPSLIDELKLNAKLKSHDLIKLSKDAGFDLHVQEVPVAEALSKLSVWAGRYPVALEQKGYAAGIPNRDELLDYGSQHTTMRTLFNRCHAELERMLPRPIGSRYESIVVTRQPGT